MSVEDGCIKEQKNWNASEKSTNSSAGATNRDFPKSGMNICQKITFYGLGFVLLVIGLLFSGFWLHLYEYIVISRLTLANGSESYETWNSNDIPLYFSIRMFNWTNPHASLNNQEKPHFREVGPYVYRLRQFKSNIQWNANDTVTYFNRQLWTFVPEKSMGSEDDEITSVNVVLLSVARSVAHKKRIFRFAVNEFFRYSGMELHMTKKAKELLFEGYDDELLDILRILKKVLPLTIPDRFGWYLPKNQSIPDVFNLYTGKSSSGDLGFIHTWNFTTHTPAFDGVCGAIGGSTGDLWPIDIAKRQNASVFISDFCSSFMLVNVGVEEVNGMDGVTFEGNESTLDNGTLHSQNKCYCPNGKCQLKSGMRNVTTCVKAPVFISFPHFYLADESYRKAVVGMYPVAEKHMFTLTFQKNFGVILKGAARLQINVHFEPISGMSMFENIPDVFVPILWFEEKIDLPVNITDKLHTSFTVIPLILSAIGLVLVIAGSILLVSGLIITRLTFQTIPYVNEKL